MKITNEHGTSCDIECVDEGVSITINRKLKDSTLNAAKFRSSTVQFTWEDIFKETSTNNNLEPCPMCGSDDVKETMHGMSYCVECQSCGVNVPGESRAEAVDKWGTRV